MKIEHSQVALLALLLMTAPAVCAAADKTAQRYPRINVHGYTYENTCSPTGRRQLSMQLSAKKIVDRAQLWKVIDVLLCGDRTLANKRYIVSSMESTVGDSNEGTGQDPYFDVMPRSMESAESLLAARGAWDATIDLDSGVVSVTYRSNEACMTSRKLRHANGRWHIFKVGEACD